MRGVRIFIKYELYEQKSGEVISWIQDSVLVPIEPTGRVAVPLPDVGTIIDFNGTWGIVTERSGLDTEWVVRCVC